METHIGLPLARRLLVTPLIMGVPPGSARATGFHVLHASTGRTSGADPAADRITAGNFYRRTANSSARSYGLEFQLALDGTGTVLHSFTGHLDP